MLPRPCRPLILALLLLASLTPTAPAARRAMADDGRRSPPLRLGEDGQGAPGPPLGTLHAPVGYEARTRWEASKESLRALVRAYVEYDPRALLGQLSPDVLQDPGLLEQAVRQDHQRQSEIRLDLELLDYHLSFAAVSVRLRWNRTAIERASGLPVVETGESRVLFDRQEGISVKGWFGDSPFGRGHAGWQGQATAGQGATPTDGQHSYRLVITDFNASHLERSHLVIDFESGEVRMVPGFGPPKQALLAASVEAREDLVLHFEMVNTDARIEAEAAQFSAGRTPLGGVVECPAGTLAALREVVGPLSAFEVITPGVGTHILGFRTEEGRHGVLEVVLGPGSNPLVELRWRLGAAPGDPVVNPGGSVSCP